MTNLLERDILVISDAHVSAAHDNVDDFFDMLNALEHLELDLVFLGDIFDLWIGIPRYLTEPQQRFLTWCQKHKDQFRIGFVEGNHEFYVHDFHQHIFRWSTSESYRSGPVLFVHGDQANPHDRNYLLLRRLTKNKWMRTFVSWLPGGGWLTQKIKRRLKDTNKAFKIAFPESEVREYTEGFGDDGLKIVVMGHFHQNFSFETQWGRALVMPDWWSTGEVAHIHRGNLKIEVKPWQAFDRRPI